MKGNGAGERLLVGSALLTVLLDQCLKYWVRTAMPLGDRRPLLAGVVHLSHVANHGAAWGMLTDQRWFLVSVSAAVVAALAATLRRIAAREPLVVAGVGLILGGAIGNLIDRLVFGAVTDMIDMDTSIAVIRGFPVFNIADSALTVGVCLLLWHAWRADKATRS